MRSIGQNPTEDEILELIMEADLNGDGTISYDEFTKMMRKKSLQQDQTEVGRSVLALVLKLGMGLGEKNGAHVLLH